MLDLPDIRVEDGFRCGPAAVATALSALNMKWSLANLTAYLATTPSDGSDPRSIEGFLRRLGLYLVAGEMDLGLLRYFTSRGIPVLCVVQSEGEGHWITVAGIKRGWVHYQDPAYGPIRLKEEDFFKIWHDEDRLGTYYRYWGIAIRKAE